jgi:hypothetical protein
MAEVKIMYKRDFQITPGFKTHLARQPAELSEEEKKKAGQTASIQRSSLSQMTSRAGDQSCANAHAAALHRSIVSAPARAPHSLLHLQRHFGNRYVQRVLAVARQSAEPAPGQDIEEAIQRKRGGGQALDSGVRRQMESSFQADFSNVRLHHDAQADTLNRAVNARAFTTGQDIFFSQGAYNPGTSGGRELLAHELTHVVQQTGEGIRPKLTVSQPGDTLEREADQVAKSVSQAEHQPEPAEHSSLQRQAEALPEEEEKREGM